VRHKGHTYVHVLELRGAVEGRVINIFESGFLGTLLDSNWQLSDTQARIKLDRARRARCFARLRHKGHTHCTG